MTEAVQALSDLVAELSPEERSLLASLLAPAPEPIAIVGIGCRFPGGANDPVSFWRQLEARTDAVREIPGERWDVDAHYDPDPEAPGKMVTRYGGFLDNVDGFDPQFFEITPREAAQMDPQQRLLLEVAWEALENAGQPPGELQKSRTGVFVGSGWRDYELLRARGESLGQVEPHSLTGGLTSVLAGRLSYALGLEGPSLAVDTACSSSLVAIHLAVQALNRGECSLALAGGVHLNLAPDAFVKLSKVRALSADGRCRTFDVRASGFARGEGVGVIVLKRLGDAERAGDRIWAVIRGSAMNHDGRSAGLTAPNGLAQRDVIRAALEAARVSPSEVSYIEAHGTGTPVGDPIELEALKEVFGQPRADGSSCLVGSLKTNLGHLEPAAGVAGVIKTALALWHGAIPAHLHWTQMNPRVSLEGTVLSIPTELRPWPRGARPRIAGVSAFGISGTNAHAILAEAPQGVAATVAPPEASSYLLPLSAKNPAALAALAGAFTEALAAGAARLHDIAYTASARRTHHEHRLAVVGRSRAEISEALAAFARGELPPAVETGAASLDGRAKVVFVFSGQGSQGPGMGRGLLSEPAFRAAIEECDALVSRCARFSLADALAAPEEASRLRETQIAQPAILAVQVGIAALLRSWGVVPDAVIGHSVGELAAAHIAGILSLEEAVRIACLRGRVMQQATGAGKMAAAALAPEEAAEVLRGLEDRVAIAAVNDPRTVVLSGEPAALDTALERLTDCQVRVRALHVDYAFHSPQMAPLRAGFLAALGDVERQSGNVPMFSTVTGDRADGLALDASYWSRGIEEPVRFAQAVGASISAGLRAFVEVGPHPALVLNVAECLAARGVEGQSIATLKRGQDEHRSMLSALGALHVQGHPLDWARLFPTGGQVVTLPTYPWQRHRFPTHAAADQRQPSSVSSAGGDLIESACYELSWIRQEDATDRPEEEPDRFLILADQAGAGAALSRELAAAGKECALVSPNAPAEAAKRIDEAAGAGGPLQVVHLWGLDAPPTERLSPSSLEAVLDHASGSLVRLLPALAKLRVPPRLWVVTRGAQPVERAGVAVAQAPLWGLGRAIALEHPDLWGGLVDLDPAADGVDARDLAAVLLSAGDEDQIAIRDSVRYVPRLVATDLPRALEPLALRPDAAYLVTGGLAGLGLEVARWMVGQGARHLVLTGRTALPPRSQWDGQLSAEVRARVEAVRALEAQGAGVVAAAVDAGDSAEMERLISAISRPLAGVVHAAGVSSWLPLTGYGSEAALRETFLPKAAGALALHGLTRDMSLDFFILFSSAAAILGGRFQGHYAAANHFLDALAHERRALGLPAASLNWGLWAAGGMSTAESRERLEAIGHRPMPVGFGLSALERAVQCDRAQQTIASVDWKTFKDLYETRRRRRLLEVIVSDDQTGDQAASTDLVRRLSDLPPRAARQTLEELVSRSVAQVLGFPEDHVLAPNRGFFQLGLDSLMAMQLMKCLGAALGRELPAVVAFEHSTVASLSEHFAELLEIGAKEVEVGPPCERDFSEDELASRLAAKLAGTM